MLKNSAQKNGKKDFYFSFCRFNFGGD